MTRYDLWVAHECFLVDSVGVLRWVDRVDNRAINGGKQGTLTCKINQALKNLLLDIKPPRLEAC